MYTLQNYKTFANVPAQIVRIKYERYKYRLGALPINSLSSVKAVHFKPTIDRIQHMAEHEIVRDGDEEIVKKV